jgi:hypothetical protein
MTRRVHLHVDRLVLRGFARADRDAIVRGLDAELVRLLSDAAVNGGFEAGSSRAALPPARFTVSPDAAPAQVGGAAARAVVDGVRR